MASVARPLRVTPTNQCADPARVHIEQLNSKYNLGVPLRDETETPHARELRANSDADFRRHDTIFKLLRFYCYQNGDGLRRILHTFDSEARLLCQKWVRKPRADHDLLPRSLSSPRATTVKEQVELQELLRALLVEQPRPPPAKRVFARVQSAPVGGASAIPFPEKTRPTSPARPAFHAATYSPPSGVSSDESLEPVPPFPSQGVKGMRGPRGVVNLEIDRIPVRGKSGAGSVLSAELSLRPSAPTNRGFPWTGSSTSTNTSTASLSTAVFSAAEDEDPLPTTQTTVEDSPEDLKELVQFLQEEEAGLDESFLSSDDLSVLHSSFSRDETPDDVSALNDSFSRDETRIPESDDSSSVQTAIFKRLASPAPNAASSSMAEATTIVAPETEGGLDSKDSGYESPPPTKLKDRLRAVWPTTPSWLEPAPFAVCWEVTRIALHCDVDLSKIRLTFQADWQDQKTLRKVLWQHPSFSRREFPEMSSPQAWEAALGRYKDPQQAPVFVASLDYNQSRSGPLYKLKLHPLKLDRTTRLSRRFGADRFMEVILPSHNSSRAVVPSVLHNEKTLKEVNHWMCRSIHALAGRMWAPFYVKDAGYKKQQDDVHLGPEVKKTVFQERMYFFAEGGYGFAPPRRDGAIPSKHEPLNQRTPLKVHDMLDWLLQFRYNGHQTYLKLFSRIALGLSRTAATIVFGKHQIRRQENDLLSTTSGAVMNDGIARMSLSVAFKIRDHLGLPTLPCAIQGRLGPAKGMWIIDVTDPGLVDWIETYPSQRKWECDLQDEDQRTLEVRSHASELKPAGLNFQLLPVLEDRAPDKKRMRSVIGKLLADNLQKDLESQKNAMKQPLQLYQWVHENSFGKQERYLHGCVPFLAGLPDRDEDAIKFLLAAGFDPRKQKCLQDCAFRMQMQKCEKLKEKLNIRIGRSAYIYMVVDFLGVLEEDEVHLCFSSQFQYDDFDDIMVDGVDVLVARSPAHYISDIQKVKAVFKRELRALKDVIVFPSKGSRPLADKLSGGDYDGDMAWVCWDSRVVDNFENAEVPEAPDLFGPGYLRKVGGTMADLMNEDGLASAVGELLERSFEFNMRESFLGRCTNFKERYCYKSGNVHDEAAVLLSTLVGHLVDQAKQGIEFGAEGWNKLIDERLKGDRHLPQPAYKAEKWEGRFAGIHHIIDHLKFEVTMPAIRAELTALHEALRPRKDQQKPTLASGKSAGGAEGEAQYFDEDLVKPFKHFREIAKDSQPYSALVQGLTNDVDAVKASWDIMGRRDAKDSIQYTQKVNQLYEKFCAIQPKVSAHKHLPGSKIVAFLQQDFLEDPNYSQWAILRASYTFTKYYNFGTKFVWLMAGRQLQWIKAAAAASRERKGTAIMMTPSMYAASRPDTRFIKQVTARLEGQGSQYAEDVEEWGEAFEDDT